ncbi:MAG TPA: LCP family protein, partial [Armatimonadota bacterium]|nr:LCP family protein [Armatimonadota bacterium]
MQHRVGQVARRPIPRRRTTRWIWRICFGMLMLAALVAGTGVGYVYFGSPTFRQVVHDYRRGMWNVDKAFPNQDELTFMVLGRDVDRDRQARVVKTNGRTDTILLVRIDFRERTANILSIPRDTKVRIPGYRGQHKINAAHAFGGPELTADTIERFLNIRPEEYVVVNYESFGKAIDMLG